MRVQALGDQRGPLQLRPCETKSSFAGFLPGRTRKRLATTYARQCRALTLAMVAVSFHHNSYNVVLVKHFGVRREPHIYQRNESCITVALVPTLQIHVYRHQLNT